MQDKRIQTVIRVEHKTEESKKQWERELNEAIEKLGYRTKAEWLSAMKRDAVKMAKARNEIERQAMIKYLLRETRYTREELEALSDDTLEKWYREERETNKDKEE